MFCHSGATQVLLLPPPLRYGAGTVAKTTPRTTNTEDSEWVIKAIEKAELEASDVRVSVDGVLAEGVTSFNWDRIRKGCGMSSLVPVCVSTHLSE